MFASIIKTKLQINKWVIIVSLFFIAFVLIAGVSGNYPTNDDWYFVRQVKAFSLGIFTLHAKVLPILLAQGFLGLFWTSIFGLSFETLRALTILVTLLSGLILYKTIFLLNKDKQIAALGMLVFLFNPLVLSSAFTFMTENYYLLFIICTMYFSIKYFLTSEMSSYYLTLAFIVLASLTRQTGVFLFAAFGISLLVNSTKKLSFLNKSVFGLLGLLTSLVVLLWPRYQTGVIDKSIDLSDGGKALVERLGVYFLALPALVFWTSPLVQIKKIEKNKTLYLVVALLAISYVIFKFDIFPLGSVFYFEGLHVKSGFKHSFSVFDNVPAKVVMSLYIGYLFIFSCRTLINSCKKLSFGNPINAFILTSIPGILSSLLVTAAVYDRYFLPLLPFLIVIMAISLKTIRKSSLIFTVIFLVINTFLVYELVSVRILKHQLFENIARNESFQVSEQDIYVDDTYSKYFYAEENEDYIGFGPSLPVGLEHSCFVQQYTIDTPLAKFLENIEVKIEKRIENPDVYGATPPIRDIRIKKHLSELSYNKMYFSPLYSIIGKTAYVGGWCEK